MTVRTAGSVVEIGGLSAPQLPTVSRPDSCKLFFDSASLSLLISADGSPYAALAGGTVDDGSNLGAGADVFRDKAGTVLRFRSLVAGAGIALTENADDITIATSGVVLAGFNVGGGDGVFRDELAGVLNFKSLIAGAGVVITDLGDELEIAAPGAAGDITGAANVGAGAGVFRDEVATILNFKTLLAGAGITLTPAADTITIASSGGDVTGAANVGAGSGWFRDEVAGVLNFKSIIGGTNLTVVAAADTLTLNVGADFAIADNVANAFRVHEAANDYIRIDTTNGAEKLALVMRDGAAVAFQIALGAIDTSRALAINTSAAPRVILIGGDAGADGAYATNVRLIEEQAAAFRVGTAGADFINITTVGAGVVTIGSAAVNNQVVFSTGSSITLGSAAGAGAVLDFPNRAASPGAAVADTMRMYTLLIGGVAELHTMDDTGAVVAHTRGGLAVANRLESTAGTLRILANATGLGFFAAAPVAQPTIAGSRGGNAALADLLTKGALLGLWVDGTSA